MPYPKGDRHPHQKSHLDALSFFKIDVAKFMRSVGKNGPSLS